MTRKRTINGENPPQWMLDHMEEDSRNFKEQGANIKHLHDLLVDDNGQLKVATKDDVAGVLGAFNAIGWNGKAVFWIGGIITAILAITGGWKVFLAWIVTMFTSTKMQ